MKISFDSLPTERKFDVKPAGFYKATISEAKFNPAQNGKQENICVVWDIPAQNGAPKWRMWDYFYYMSDKETPKYKFARLLLAAGLNLTGTEFESKEIVKALPGRQMVIDVTVQKNNRTGQDQNVIEVFKNDCYYPASEWAALTGGQEVAPEAPDLGDDDLPFDMDAPDGEEDTSNTTAPPAADEDY